MESNRIKVYSIRKDDEERKAVLNLYVIYIRFSN